MHHFGYFMGGQQATRGNWFDRMPVDSMFLSGAVTDDPESTLLVDIGGGKGHDVAAFHKAFPRAPGKLVLQDLPPVIESIDSLDPAIVQQPYDFFTEQPVKGEYRKSRPYIETLTSTRRARVLFQVHHARLGD